jgi:hypothetical protein
MSSFLRGCWFSPLLTPSRTIAKLSPTSLSEIQAYSAISLSWVESVTSVRVLESPEKPSEHPTLEHLLISLKIFEASFTLGAFAPRQLEVARSSNPRLWKLQEVCITPVNQVETLSSQEFILLTWDRGKGQALSGESILVWIPQQHGHKQAFVASWTTG